MKYKAIIIDDERKAIAILRNKIERFCPNIEIIGADQNPKEGIDLINRLKPDLLFLDVAMPEMNGFEMLSKFDSPNFEIIFVTAFDEFALEAIKHCAIGYLLKPVDNTDLVNTIDYAIENILKKTALEKNKFLLEKLGLQTFHKEKIVIPTQEGLEFIKIDQIVHCQGEDGYTKIYFEVRKPILSSKSIGHFHKLLENQDFYLVHKSYLVNMLHIKKYLKEGYVVMSNDFKLAVSRNRRAAFLDKIREQG